MATYNIKVGTTLHLTASLFDAGGSKVLGNVTWVSSNPAVATVASADNLTVTVPFTIVDRDPTTGVLTDETAGGTVTTYPRTTKAWVLHGVITALSAGTTTITVTDNAQGITNTATINVSDGVTVASVVIGTR